MCEPLTLTAMGLAAGGAAANAAGAAKARKATGQTYQVEAGRQSALQASALADVKNTSKGFSADHSRQGLDKAAQRRTASIQGMSKGTPISSKGTPKIIKAEGSRASGEATRDAGIRNKAAARIGAYSDNTLNRGIKLSDLASRVGTNATRRNISQSALPLELAAAGEKGKTLRSLGDGLTVASMLTGLAGAAGMFSGGTTATQAALPHSSRAGEALKAAGARSYFVPIT